MVTLQAEIADLYELSSGLFGFTLKNGYCAVGWRNAAGLMDSAAFDTTIDLPDTEKVLTPQYGLIQVYFTGSTIDGFSTLPLKEGGGMIICLSADERTAYVTSILPSPVLPEAVFLQAVDAASVYGGSLLDITPQGTVLTGWVKQSDGQGLNLVDTVNHTFSTLVIPDAETLKYCDQFSLTKDNRYIIAWNEGGRIYRIGADGQTESLALGEHVVLDKINDLEMVDAKYWADAARQTADGSIIAATCDGKQITFWRDGGQMENIPVPQDTRWTVVSGWSMPRLFRIGPNGLMVLSDFASEASTELEHFSVYHFAEKKWKQMDDAAHGSPDRLMAFGRQSPVFAVYDEDMRLRIYDYHAAAPVHCMPIDLPAISIAKIEMLLDDQYICLLTKDGQAMIYCIQTNELVFCTAVDTDYATVDADQFFLWPDPANQRLYLSSGQHVQCIDLRTWEPLFTGKNFAFYHAGQNEIYVKVYDWADSTISLKAVPIPSTDQMIEITRNALY